MVVILFGVVLVTLPTRAAAAARPPAPAEPSG
jgi:hypothetical protein